MWDRIAFIALYALALIIAVVLVTAVIRPFLPPPDAQEADRRAKAAANREHKA